MGRKKILSLYRVNEKKEAIVQKIFQKLGSRGRGEDEGCLHPGDPGDWRTSSMSRAVPFFPSPKTWNMWSWRPDTRTPPGYHGIGKSFPVKE